MGSRCATVQKGLRQVLAPDLGDLGIRQVGGPRVRTTNGAGAKNSTRHAREPRVVKRGRAQLRTRKSAVHVQGE